MVEKVEMRLTFSRMLDVSWDLSQPITPPGGYRLEYKCRQLDSSKVYLNNVMKIHSLHKSCLLGPIRTQTLCSLTLFAIYNEASLDPGLKFAFKDESPVLKFAVKDENHQE